MNRPGKRSISPSSYHGRGSTDYRNIAIPNPLHKRVAHIAIDLEVSISEITSVLIDDFCGRVESGSFDIDQWHKDLAAWAAGRK